MSARRQDVDDRLLSMIKTELLAPAAVAEVKRHLHELASTTASENGKRKRALAARRSEVEREIGNLVQAIATVGISEALQKRLASAERELVGLCEEEAGSTRSPGSLADVVPRYKRLVMDLQGALARDTTRARAMLQEIFGEIRLVETGEELYAEFEAPLERLMLAAGGALLGRVAGAGFEPATFGL